MSVMRRCCTAQCWARESFRARCSSISKWRFAAHLGRWGSVITQNLTLAASRLVGTWDEPYARPSRATPIDNAETALISPNRTVRGRRAASIQ